jgi:zinc transport system substrate-binding protein
MRALLLAALLPMPALAQPSVVTDIAPVHALVARIMQGVAEPELLVGPGAEPHAFQMRPSQARALAEADAVFWIGPQLTPWLAPALEGLADPAAAVALAGAEGVTARPPLDATRAAADADDHGEGHEDDLAEDHGGDHASGDDHAAESDHAGHDHGAADPHVWLDPRNAAAMTEAIVRRLVAADPANAEAYKANAAAALGELAALDAELDALLAPVRARPFVVFHDAYAHLAGRYGLTVAGALAETDAAAPGAAQVAALRDLVAGGGAVCVFAEAQHDDRLLAAATEGTEAGHATLDPEGSTLPPGPDAYALLMRNLATTIATCLAEH